MGTSWSASNGRYANTVIRLQHSARRRTRKRGCTCMFKRPAWLQVRRKTHKKLCRCNKKSQVKSSGPPSAITSWSPTKNLYYDNPRGYCSRGTETCFCEENISTRDVKYSDKTGKNVCRFTVDAYFV